MSTFENYAVFIGVSDYSKYGASASLPGSVNDARLFWRVCRKMGFAPENMRILTSPRLDPADLDGGAEANVREATSGEIVEAMKWLADKLGGEGRPAGLLTYSGHGDWLEGKGLVLCPSDVTGSNLDNALPFLDIRTIFAERLALSNLTAIVDCCHAAATVVRPDRQPMSLTGRPAPTEVLASIPPFGARQLVATKPEGSSWQAHIAGLPRGAFSWAVACVMEQWAPRPAGKSVELGLSYGDLLSRAKQLLGALSFEQEPVLLAPAGVEVMPMLGRVEHEEWEETSAEPTARRKRGQLRPDVYELVLTVPDDSKSPYKGTITVVDDTEYWTIDRDFVRAAQLGSTKKTITMTASGNSRPPTPSSYAFRMSATRVSWTHWTGGSHHWDTYRFWWSSDPNFVSMNFFTLSVDSNGTWSGSIQWHVVSTVEPTYAFPEGTFPEGRSTRIELEWNAGPSPFNKVTWEANTAVLR